MNVNEVNIEKISFKELFKIAKKGVESLTSVKEADFRLEQAEYKKDEHLWEVVISFLVENVNIPEDSPFVRLSPQLKFERMYKAVKINDHKEVVGLYMYND